MMMDFRDLKVYQKSFALAMDIFEQTKSFPKSELFALTDQLRRSSRSVCRAIAEGYRKRQYPNHFSSKMSDADMENTETIVSLDFALYCNYIILEKHNQLVKEAEEVGRMLGHMVKNPEKFLPRK